MTIKLALQKAMVGHYIESIPESNTKKINYVMQGDGLWQVRKNRIGTFYMHTAEANIPGLESTISEGWELNVPRIPLDLWKKTLAFFKDVQKVHDTEAYLQFYYDLTNEQYILHCPKQEVSKAAVKYTTDAQFEKENIAFVLEIHSHGTMGAFFSGTDNADEKSDRFFGVIGHISQSHPEYKFRLMMGGHEVEVEFSDIFEAEADSDYPKDWLERIKKEKPIVGKSRGKIGQKLTWTKEGWKDSSQQIELFSKTLEEEINESEDRDWDHYFSKSGKYNTYFERGDVE